MIERNCDVKDEMAKPESVDRVCKTIKKQLALPDDFNVTGESNFEALGAYSLDMVEIVMGLEKEFVLALKRIMHRSSITTVQETADLIEDIIQKRNS